MRAGGRLGNAQHDAALRSFEPFWASVASLEIRGTLMESAAALAAKHVLRAYDAVQLAGAIALRGDELVFACFDVALRAAATAEGLSSLPGDETI